jgi:hypothetical protein
MTPPKVLFSANSPYEIADYNDYSSYNESAKFAGDINYDGIVNDKLGSMG